MKFSIDIELTNRCNAKCHFCPRDQTPHEGTMTREVFDQSLRRAIEYRDRAAELLGAECTVSLCGLGEPLLNKHAAAFVADVKAAGFECAMSSNGSLLSEKRAQELIDAGLDVMLINAGEEGQDYEDIYKLAFAKTHDNIVRFAKMSKHKCRTHIVLVDHRRDPAHVARMKEYWAERGIGGFFNYEVMNRGGALFVDHMQFESYPQLARARDLLEPSGTPLCGAPFGYMFIGYDGQYYLCCSDWKKETPMGSVFDESFESVMQKKLEHLVTRDPVCRTCNLDPLNRLTEELRASDEGLSDATIDATVQSVVEGNETVRTIIGAFGLEIPEAPARPARRLLPLQVN